MINGFATDEQRALFIAFLCDALAATGVDELDRTALAESFAPLKRMVEEATATAAKKPGAMARLAFRMLLGQYLRRDEDVLNRRASRGGRTIAMMRVVMGRRDFQ